MLQGEVSVTMCRVREKFWVPKLRSLTKKVIRNWKNICATGKWLFTLKKDHNLASYIGALNKRWKFNLARAPWWGGFFKRLIGHDHEQGTFKGSLTYSELEDILIDIENCTNHRPLLYQGEAIEQPVLNG